MILFTKSKQFEIEFSGSDHLWRVGTHGRTLSWSQGNVSQSLPSDPCGSLSCSQWRKCSAPLEPPWSHCHSQPAQKNKDCGLLHTYLSGGMQGGPRRLQFFWTTRKSAFLKKSTIKVCDSCSWRGPDTIALGVEHLTVSLMLCSSNHMRRVRGPWRAPYHPKKPLKDLWRRRGTSWEEGKRKVSLPRRVILICPPGKPIIFVLVSTGGPEVNPPENQPIYEFSCLGPTHWPFPCCHHWRGPSFWIWTWALGPWQPWQAVFKNPDELWRNPFTLTTRQKHRDGKSL